MPPEKRKQKTQPDPSQRLITFKPLQSLTWGEKKKTKPKNTPKHSLLPLPHLPTPKGRTEPFLFLSSMDITKSQTNSEVSRRITLLWNRARTESTMFPPLENQQQQEQNKVLSSKPSWPCKIHSKFCIDSQADTRHLTVGLWD